MASPAGRGAQVRLEGTAQAAARGAVARDMDANVIAKRALEAAGTVPDGSSVDGSTRTGIAAEDEVLAPGGVVAGGGTVTFGTTAGTAAEGNDSRITGALSAGTATTLYAAISHTQPASTISDSTTAGRALLTAADAPAQRTALALGTAATSPSTAFAAAAHQHGVADLTATGTKDTTTFLRGDNTWAAPAGGGGVATWYGGGAGVQYVSKDGNDSNDGLSWQKAKLTVAAAVTALPTKTAGLGSEVITAGTVFLGMGTFVEQGNIPVMEAIRIVGVSSAETQASCIQLAASRNCDLFTYTTAFNTADAYSHGVFFENVVVDGNYLNQGSTTLSAALTNVATSLTVASAAAFPASGTFDILIDDEVLTVTAGAGTTTWTVTRGKYQGKAGVAHSSGATVRFAGTGIVMRGGGFNCGLKSVFVKNCGGPAVRLDVAAVNFAAFDFTASTCGGPAFAYMPVAAASGCAISIQNTQFDDCGVNTLYFDGAQNGPLIAHLSAIKAEARVSTTKHQHVIAHYPSRATNDGAGMTLIVDGCIGFGLSGGREAVCYQYNGTNQAAAWELSGVIGVDGYTSAFKTAKDGWQSSQPALQHLTASNFTAAQGTNAAVEIGRLQIAEAGWNPEGGFVAQRGSLFAQGGSSDYAVLKTKATGTGNTGWTAVDVLMPVFTQTDGATITWATGSAASPNASVTLGGSRTLAITGAVSGQRGTMIVKQDATGGRVLTLPAGSVKSGTPTTTANAVNQYDYVYDGTNYFWTITPNLV